MERHWRAVAASRQTLQSWGDAFVVYHTGSGDTLQLDRVAGRILQCLIEKLHSEAAVISLLADELLVAEDDAFIEYIASRFVELESLSFIKRM